MDHWVKNNINYKNSHKKLNRKHWNDNLKKLIQNQTTVTKPNVWPRILFQVKHSSNWKRTVYIFRQKLKEYTISRPTQ